MAADSAADGVCAERGDLLLIQFARAPQEGHVKTRMIPHLCAAAACELHCELTLWTCRQLLASELGEVELSVAGDTRHTLFARCLEMGVARITPQCGTNLGERMYNALQRGLERFASVILVGSDCPGIDASYLQRAAVSLRTAPVVLGPAADGGYVLIGVRDIDEVVFNDIPWGSDLVFAKTVNALTRVGLEWVALPCLSDIDRPADLPVWEALKRNATNIPAPNPRGRVSPVVASNYRADD